MELRKLIKENALLQLDGDYDIIWKNFKNKKVKTSKGEVPLVDVISDNIEANGKSNEKKKQELNDFANKYKRLQIAVPVNCEDWDTENFHPLVTYLPYEYEDNWEHVTAFDSNGETVLLDAINPPDVPVIVISLNERSDENGDLLGTDKQLKAVSKPPVPVGLEASISGGSILLSWVMPQGYVPGVAADGYQIYRKKNGEADFTKIGENDGFYNMVYYDSDLDPNYGYSYYVRAGLILSSDPSDPVSCVAPSRPNPVSSFEAKNYALGTVFLNWQNDNNQYVDGTVIERAIVESNPSFSILQILSNSENSYFDNNLTSGNTYHYKIYSQNNVGNSDAQLDFVKVPYRDISQYSGVYIKKISFTNWEIERWLAGKPEFYVTVANVNPTTKDPYKVQDQINLEFSSRSSSSDFTGVKVLDWKPGFWYDMLSFYAVEYDVPSGELTVDLGVKYNSVEPENAVVNTSGSANFEIKFEHKGEKCWFSLYRLL